MTDNHGGDHQTAVSEPKDLPSPEGLPEVKIYSHSDLFYWWPAWVAGYILATLSYLRGGVIELDDVRSEYFHPSSTPGFTYVIILLTLIFFTNVKLRGVYSIVLILSVALISTVFALLGWWDDIFAVLPLLSVHMNFGFYIAFSTGLLVLWLLMFFVFDRFVWVAYSPGANDRGAPDRKRREKLRRQGYVVSTAL